MSEQNQTKITILGNSTAVPETGNDSPTFLINDRYLVDTGWWSVESMRARGIDPVQLEYVIFTHFHHDHYMGLPQLLYYLIMRHKPLKELKIIGPAEDLELIVRRSISFLHPERYYTDDVFPTLIPIAPGESYEAEGFRLDTCTTIHPVQGICCRFTDKANGKVFSFTGDTAYHPPIIEHVRGSALLIHEAALGPIAAAPDDNAYMHSGSIDAARIAEAAGVEKLLLIHAAASRAEPSVQAAKEAYRGEVEWARFGHTYVL